MSEVTKPTAEESLSKAGPLMLARQENPSGQLTDNDKAYLSEATLAIVREFRQGRTKDEIQSQLTGHGWKPTVAEGFISLVSQLLSKMYFQRTWIFAGLSLVTSMLASIAVPQAAAGEFPWLSAVLSLGIAIVCVLGMPRNYQLYRQFRQRPAEMTR